MFDHVGIVFSDLKRGGDFYRAVLAELDIRPLEDHTQPDGTGWLVFSSGQPESPFFVVQQRRGGRVRVKGRKLSVAPRRGRH